MEETTVFRRAHRTCPCDINNAIKELRPFSEERRCDSLIALSIPNIPLPIELRSTCVFSDGATHLGCPLCRGVKDQPAVIMLVQLEKDPIAGQPCGFK